MKHSSLPQGKGAKDESSHRAGGWPGNMPEQDKHGLCVQAPGFCTLYPTLLFSLAATQRGVKQVPRRLSAQPLWDKGRLTRGAHTILFLKTFQQTESRFPTRLMKHLSPSTHLWPVPLIRGSISATLSFHLERENAWVRGSLAPARWCMGLGRCWCPRVPGQGAFCGCWDLHPPQLRAHADPPPQKSTKTFTVRNSQQFSLDFLLIYDLRRKFAP